MLYFWHRYSLHFAFIALIILIGQMKIHIRYVDKFLFHTVFNNYDDLCFFCGLWWSRIHIFVHCFSPCTFSALITHTLQHTARVHLHTHTHTHNTCDHFSVCHCWHISYCIHVVHARSCIYRVTTWIGSVVNVLVRLLVALSSTRHPSRSLSSSPSFCSHMKWTKIKLKPKDK